jgi:hypothetical protein
LHRHNSEFFGNPPLRSNHCRPKRLKPEQQIGPVGLQYDGTKILYRSATDAATAINLEPAIADPRGDELQSNL